MHTHFNCNVGSRLDWEASKLVSFSLTLFFPVCFQYFRGGCYHGDRALISLLSVSQGPIENDVMIHVALIAESQR